MSPSIGLAGLADALAAAADWLAIASVRIALLCLVVFVASRLRRAATARAQVVFWRTALVSLVLLCVLPSSLPRALSLPAALTFERSRGAQVVPASEETASRRLAPKSVPTPFASPVRPPERARAELVAHSRVLAWPQLLATVWALGLLVHLLRLGAGAVALTRCVRASSEFVAVSWTRELAQLQRGLGCPGRVRLRTTRWQGAPALVGLARSTVLLPAACRTWTRARRRAVLAHELLHLAHRDPWFTHAAALLRAVFWFHPGVRWVVRETARHQELRCDRDAVNAGLDPLEYAESLVEVARSTIRVRPALGVAFSHRSGLEERVRAILAPLSADSGLALRSGAHASGPVIALLLASSAASAFAVRAAAPIPSVAPSAARADRHGAVLLALPADLERLRLGLSCDVRVVAAGAESGLRVRDTSTAGGGSQAFLERLVVTRREGEWEVRDPRAERDASIAVELLAPASLALDVHVHLGMLTCAAPLASLEAHVALGSIQFEPGAPPQGRVDLHVANGSLTARIPRLTGLLRASGGVADLRVSLLEPGSFGELELSTGRGDITLELADASRARFETTASMGSVILPRALSETALPSAVLEGRLVAGYGSVRVLERSVR